MKFPREDGLVSIVVPSYNRERYIRECLDSLAAQTYPDIEIIIVDDGSKDRTGDRVRDFVREVSGVRPGLEGRVVFLTLPRNVGYVGPLTMGMFLSRGEFIAVQDSDDLSHPERIQKQVHYLRSNRGVGLVGSQYSGFNKDSSNISEKPASWIRYGEDILKTYKNGGHCICHGTILIRGSVFDRLGGYNRSQGKAADYEFIARCVLGGVRAANIPEVLYYYRRHAMQMSGPEYRRDF